MSAKIEKCPLCDLAADINGEATFTEGIIEGGYGGPCNRCGQIRVMEAVVSRFRESKTRYLLSAFFRRYPAQQKVPLVTLENVDELIAGMPILRTVPEKMDGLLKRLAGSELPPGYPITFDFRKDYPLIFAADWVEANFLLGELSSRGFTTSNASNQLQVTAKGYERFEELQATAHKSTRNAFVAMWFDNSRDEIWKKSIEPAISDAGYRPIRIDKAEYVTKIDDEIIANLRQSRFLVADFTGQRPGVYYEAGFMHGLGRNVFWMVKKVELGAVHFDLRQYNFIDYESVADAKDRLYNRILAVEGKGPG